MIMKRLTPEQAFLAFKENREIYTLQQVDSSITVMELIQRDDLVMFEDTPQEPKLEPQSDEKEEEADPDMQKVPLKKPGRKAGVPKQTKPEADHGKIIALWKAGWPVKKIAGEMYLSEATIYNHINREKNGNDTD